MESYRVDQNHPQPVAKARRRKIMKAKSGSDFAATHSSHTGVRGGEGPGRNCARGKIKPRNYFAKF